MVSPSTADSTDTAGVIMPIISSISAVQVAEIDPDLADTAARRALVTKLPPLPAEFSESQLRIHLGFNFAQDRG